MPKILLINDEADITLSVGQVLDDRGFNIDSYEDPVEALENFKPKLYDRVIIDGKMPKMDGFTFYRETKALDSGVKICFLTAAELSEKFPEDIALSLPDSHVIRIPIGNDQDELVQHRRY